MICRNSKTSDLRKLGNIWKIWKLGGDRTLRYLAMTVKNYAKADVKVFCSSTILLDFIYFVHDCRSFCNQGPGNKWMEQENNWISKINPILKWDRIFVSLPSKYWLLLPMKLNFLEFLNDSKLLLKQWKPKRSQFWVWQLIMICNKNFNNNGNKHKILTWSIYYCLAFFNNLLFTILWGISSYL